MDCCSIYLKAAGKGLSSFLFRKPAIRRLMVPFLFRKPIIRRLKVPFLFRKRMPLDVMG